MPRIGLDVVMMSDEWVVRTTRMPSMQLDEATDTCIGEMEMGVLLSEGNSRQGRMR